MLVCNVHVSLFRVRVAVIKSLERCHLKYYNGRITGKPQINVVSKRGSMLLEMIANKDKRKNWHFSVMSNRAQTKIFEKVHKPHRRRAVLNSLFIRNITDVISTGEVVPEISNYNIEITGVQVSPCYKLVNVFWQVSVNHYDLCDNIGQLLNIAAPKIRAELISRNVLGRVPFIFFIRDCTNARVAAFEQALQKLESEPKSESCIVADDSFIEDMYKFKESNVKPVLKSPDLQTEPVTVETKNEDLTIPKKPADMRSDIFGLDHNAMMEKVVALKKKTKNLSKMSAVISPESLSNEDDVFSKIPGIHFKADSKESSSNRQLIFKKFRVERKMLMEQSKNVNHSDDYELHEVVRVEENDIEFIPFDEDFVEDEIVDNYK